MNMPARRPQFQDQAQMTTETPKHEPSAWSILRVTPLMERKVAASLGPKTDDNPRGAGLQTYVPIERYRPPNHWKARTRPLIPGYVFAEILSDDDLDLARENYAVRDVMSRGEHPVRLEPIVIGTLMFLEACHAFDRTWKPPPFRNRKRGGRKPGVIETRWAKGQRIRLREGSGTGLDGHVGEVMASPRAHRLEVLLMLFGRLVTTEVGEDQVEAANDDAATTDLTNRPYRGK